MKASSSVARRDGTTPAVTQHAGQIQSSSKPTNKYEVTIFRSGLISFTEVRAWAELKTQNIFRCNKELKYFYGLIIFNFKFKIQILKTFRVQICIVIIRCFKRIYPATFLTVLVLSPLNTRVFGRDLKHQQRFGLSFYEDFIKICNSVFQQSGCGCAPLREN